MYAFFSKPWSMDRKIIFLPLCVFACQFMIFFFNFCSYFFSFKFASCKQALRKGFDSWKFCFPSLISDCCSSVSSMLVTFYLTSYQPEINENLLFSLVNLLLTFFSSVRFGIIEVVKCSLCLISFVLLILILFCEAASCFRFDCMHSEEILILL